IYKEIGSGERISLCKLAVDYLEQEGRPLRLAIDFSIWQFQVQAARGGSNPAIRTLFYRLTRLLSLGIRPLFVFDGPNKPAFKRNKRSSGRGDTVSTAMAKHLIRLFGFVTHEAPGEAEAECALLEQKGVVDAVLSEDVDTIMFGCRRTLRNWSAEGPKGSKTPTHVSMFDAVAIAAGPAKLDREGMVLVALMSGGDYLPEGVPGCGVKVACEAARAGFGRDLCRFKRADSAALAAWKAKLLHELRTNENGHFRTRHRALEIPDDFPNMEILRFYTHPVVSREDTVERLRSEFLASSSVDIVGLREFTRQTFDWQFKTGAIKLIRVLAPSLLPQKLLERSKSAEQNSDDLELKQRGESALVKAISNRRAHFSTDSTPELRISFVPADIVDLDLDKEPEEEAVAFGRSGIALNSDDEFDEEAAQAGGGQPISSARKVFDPLQPDLVWIPESLAKLGIPLTVEDWEGRQRAKEQQAAAKASRKPRAKKTDMPAGALDKYFKETKRIGDDRVKVIPRLEPTSSPPRINSPRDTPASRGRSKQIRTTPTSPQAEPSAGLPPWKLASSQARLRAAKSSSSAISQVQPKPSSTGETIIISSSPAATASNPAPSSGVSEPLMKPTRTKKANPPMESCSSPESLSSRSSSSGKQIFLALEGRAARQPAVGAQPSMKPRPFKRVKSGTSDTIKPALAQRSIKDFGRLSKGAGCAKETLKHDPGSPKLIEVIVSDDDEMLPPPIKRSSGSNISSQTHTPPGVDRFSTFSGDDPFFSPPLLRRAASPSPWPMSTIAVETSTISKRGQEKQTTVDKENSDTAFAPTAVISLERSAKTTIYRIDGKGYVSAQEIDRDKADEIVAAHNDGPQQSKAPRRRAWRQSDISVLDLTGED
ncbi:hypothetical protein P885DRAFT_40074, partial [Corynascus similis CBS 632.67]